MNQDIINELEAKIQKCDERIDFYLKSIKEHPDDVLFGLCLNRCRVNKANYEEELACERLKESQ